MSAAAGYLYTGEFVLWDFHREEPGGTYTRGRVYLWQVAQSLRLLGFSEGVARVPSLLWGILLAPLAWLATRRETRGAGLAGLVALLVCFDGSQILFSRMCRFYGMLITAYFTVAWLAYRFAERWLTPEPDAPLQRSTAWGTLGSPTFWLALAGLALGAGLLAELHVISLILLPALVLHFAIVTAATLRRPSATAHWVVVGVILVGAGGAFSVALTLKLAGWLPPIEGHWERSPLLEVIAHQLVPMREPHWLYLEYLGGWHRSTVAALALASIGACTALLRARRERFAAWCAVNLLAIAVFFIFFGRRYPAFQYIAYARPFLMFAIAYGAFTVGKALLGVLPPRLPARRAIATWAGALLALVLVWRPSVPGVPAGPILGRAVADDDYRHSSNPVLRLHPDYRTMYGFVRANAHLGRRVASSVRRSYYRSTDVEWIGLGRRSCDLERYERAMAGGVQWFVQPIHKRSHLCPELWDAVERDFLLHDTTGETNFIWGLRRDLDPALLRQP